MGYLSKFKSVSRVEKNTNRKSDIDSLLKNELWVSTYQYMNDKNEIPIYYEDYSIDERKVKKYREKIEDNYCCISLSTTSRNKRLWDYYTNGMRGMAIVYTYDSIRKSLSKNHVICLTEGKVQYDGKKTLVTRQDMRNMDFVENNINIFLHKDDTWKEEKEYRFVFKYDKSKKYYEFKEGFNLKNIKPHHILIGYKMDKTDRKEIIEYCKNKKVCLYEVSPKLTSPNMKDFNINQLVDTKGKRVKRTRKTK